jgi:hypothetical protein
MGDFSSWWHFPAVDSFFPVLTDALWWLGRIHRDTMEMSYPPPTTMNLWIKIDGTLKGEKNYGSDKFQRQQQPLCQRNGAETILFP